MCSVGEWGGGGGGGRKETKEFICVLGGTKELIHVCMCVCVCV